MQVMKGLGRDGPVCLLQIIVKFVVSIKTKALFGRWQMRSEFSPPTSKLVAVSAIKKTRRRSKTSKGLQRMGGRQNSQKISAPAHVIKIYQMRPIKPDPSCWKVTLKENLCLNISGVCSGSSFIILSYEDQRVRIPDPAFCAMSVNMSNTSCHWTCFASAADFFFNGVYSWILYALFSFLFWSTDHLFGFVLHHLFLPVLEIQILIRRIRMFLGLPDPDPLVRGTDPDQDPSLFSWMFWADGNKILFCRPAK